jgi:hypothetical protein
MSEKCIKEGIKPTTANPYNKGDGERSGQN